MLYRDDANFATLRRARIKLQMSSREVVPMLFCCHPPGLPLPDALPPLTAAPRQAPSADAILGRLQVQPKSVWLPGGLSCEFA